MVSNKWDYVLDAIIDGDLPIKRVNTSILMDGIRYLDGIIEISNDPILKAKRTEILNELEAR